MVIKVKLKKKKDKEIVVEDKPNKKQRLLPKFKAKRDWIMLIEYRPELRSEQLTYQKIGFRIEGNFKSAWDEAEKLCKLIGKGLAIDLHELQKVRMSRVVGLYAKNAFKDWQHETASYTDGNKHVKEAIKMSKGFKEKTKPKSFLKEINKEVKVR